MTIFDRLAPAEALEDLLEKERQALLAGRFDVLERLIVEKIRLAEAVARGDPGHDALIRLRAAGARNADLLDAMRQGLQAARTRLGEMKRPAGLETYDATGRKQAFPPATAPAGRRA